MTQSGDILSSTVGFSYVKDVTNKSVGSQGNLQYNSVLLDT